ncbi:MAG: GNAT family N-acetyltransferase [Candidatus Saccharibacteria bacterium]|nr:GNAT family N-acetyltransferase [Microbacteriaceae bacterium]
MINRSAGRISSATSRTMERLCGSLTARSVAYLLLEQVDGAAHIEQVTVHPDHARQRIGAQLIAVADSWAWERGLPAVTLTTFRDVPWNAPYYERLGFRAFLPRDWGTAMGARMDSEASRGLQAWPRVAMIRPVSKLSTPEADVQG